MCKKCADCRSSAPRANGKCGRQDGGGVGGPAKAQSQAITHRGSLQPDPSEEPQRINYTSGWSHRNQGAGSVSVKAKLLP